MQRKAVSKIDIHKIGPWITLFIAIVIGSYIFVSSKQDNEIAKSRIATFQSHSIQETATVSSQNTQEAGYKSATETADAEKRKKETARLSKLKSDVENVFPGVICWGDSLTAGGGGKGATYPNVLQRLIEKEIYPNIPVVNCGVGGENSITIAGRSGAIPFVIAEPVLIPANRERVRIEFNSSSGAKVSPLRQQNCGVNPVVIDNIDGQIDIEQESYTSKDFHYFFLRKNNGNEIEFKPGDQIITSGSVNYQRYIPVIFIGQNGGWSNPTELISQQKAMIDYQNTKDNKFIIIGLSSGDSKSRRDLEAEMKNAYGDKFINLREYLSTKALSDAGIVPTNKDNEAMSAGSVPPSLLSDTVHFNAQGYELIGRLVFERMKSLEYFKEVTQIINQ
jgi:lysophospholipase L1-like esterase